MFSFQKSCEISFQVVKDEGLDNELLSAVNLYLASTEPVTASKPVKRTVGFKRKARVLQTGLGTKSPGEDDKKKILHRDTERQRRVAMAALLNSLCSLLPTEIVQGKRSVSDHIEETVCYIKHLKNRIKELQDKREMLTTLQANSANNSPSPLEEDSSCSNIPCSVAIYTSNGGVEIQISGGNPNHGFRFSEALNVLLEEGLSVVCSVSTKVNGALVHNIHCQVSDTIDVQRLQQRLSDLVSSNRLSSDNYAPAIEYCPIEWMEKETQLYSLLNFA